MLLGCVYKKVCADNILGCVRECEWGAYGAGVALSAAGLWQDLAYMAYNLGDTTTTLIAALVTQNMDVR